MVMRLMARAGVAGRAQAGFAAALVAASFGLPSIARACPSCQVDQNGDTWWVIGIFMVTPWFVVGAVALLIRWLRKLEREEEAPPASAPKTKASPSPRPSLAAAHLRIVEDRR